MKAVLATVGVLVAFGLVCVVGYLGGWWLTEDSTNRQAKINYNSYGAQTGNADALVRKVSEINIAVARGDDPAVIVALTTDACQRNARLNEQTRNALPPSVLTFVSQEC